jgi:hypothetical protein
MKQAIGFVLMWIHCLVLSSMASVTAEAEGWPMPLAVAAWIGGVAMGIFPIVRTLALFSLLLLSLPWWQAAGITVLAAFVLLSMEQAGKRMFVAR